MTSLLTDTLIIGSGSSGLAAAHFLGRAGVDALVLEASSQAGGSWRNYYDSLRLFSPGEYSELPGMPFPGGRKRYPVRDEVVRYLADYAERVPADVRTGHRVTSVMPPAETSTGSFVTRGEGFEVMSKRVIVASGNFGAPHIPTVESLGTFSGRVLHSSGYRSPESFAGMNIAIVGSGNSAVQIAAELAEVANVGLYTRHAVRWMPQVILGRDVHWWLKVTGADTSRLVARVMPRQQPVIDDGTYRAVLRGGKVTRHNMFVRVDGDTVIGRDGERNSVDAIIFATGFRPDIPFLAGTAAVDGAGAPIHREGISTTVPGLAFMGLEHQRTFASATLRGVGADAHNVVKRLLAAA